ncbi:Hypothetical_protein [Hexamita inflata]|uniref:Hypothetical_protein n=1 Tax=Hexamita inflata TaxID=28002 RepID=A0AA86PS84_9EUKA|nr:Hypothetical protein HINF_LOCUS22367 [Hexamita inflata]CAI9942552.1 Hypothetical protein HINF_LOCUS30197 [Hexamita inflata]CAI9942554.1 Hypothetical protein HINF_LOCUS30199 [Hexamita inflata]CAI9942558.1 Hypothetical protein HINF_LOCUS30203 [Hexamita inflata]
MTLLPFQIQKHYALQLIPQSQYTYPISKSKLQMQLLNSTYVSHSLNFHVCLKSLMLVQVPNLLRLSEEYQYFLVRYNIKICANIYMYGRLGFHDACEEDGIIKRNFSTVDKITVCNLFTLLLPLQQSESINYKEYC